MLVKATVPRDPGSRRNEQVQRHLGIAVALQGTARRQRALQEQPTHDVARPYDHVVRPDITASAFAASLRSTAALLESCLRAEERLFYARYPGRTCNSAAARSMRRRLRILRTTIAKLELAGSIR